MRLFGRQGDVGFIKRKVPKGAKKIPFRPFALGEVTGHSHAVKEGYEHLVEMYAEDGTVFVRCLEEVPVRHEDHDPEGTTSILDPGSYEITIAREYDEEAGWRNVAD